jgi:hypothetical protein
MDLGKHRRSLTVVPVRTDEPVIEPASDDHAEESAQTREE